jgi:CheY-like chemotaxis protein
MLLMLCGPPLPGRWAFARALERRLRPRRFADACEAHAGAIVDALGEGALVLADGDLCTRAERQRLLETPERWQRSVVEWRCGREHADREVFHRYASRPAVLARAEWARYLDDAGRRQQVVDDEQPGRVARVDAALPLDDQVAAVERLLGADPPAPCADGARSVLVVDDDADQRAMLADVLTELGFSVELAPDAGVALALLDDGAHVELLITDHLMPGMTGVELTRAVRRRHPHVRSVLLTAYGDDRTAVDALAADAVTLLAKPLRLVDLERALDEATARSSPSGP